MPKKARAKSSDALSSIFWIHQQSKNKRFKFVYALIVACSWEHEHPRVDNPAAAVKNTLGGGARTGLWNCVSNFLLVHVLSAGAQSNREKYSTGCQDVILSHKLGELGQIQQVKQQNGVERNNLWGCCCQTLQNPTWFFTSAGHLSRKTGGLDAYLVQESHQVRYFCANARKKTVSDGWVTAAQASSCFSVSLAPAVSRPAASATWLSHTCGKLNANSTRARDHMTARLLYTHCTWRRVCVWGGGFELEEMTLSHQV